MSRARDQHWLRSPTIPIYLESRPVLPPRVFHLVLVQTTPNRCVRWIPRPQLALGQQWYACGAMQWPTARPDPRIIQRSQIRVLCSVPRASRLAGWGALVLLDMRTTVVLGQVGVGEPNARTCLGWFGRGLGELSPRTKSAAIPNNRNMLYYVTSESFLLGSRPNHPKQVPT